MALNRAKVLETADKLVRQGKLDEAIRHYVILSDDNPRDVNTINRIGDLYVRMRKNKEGIRQFMRIADLYASDGFHLKAIAMYKKITKLEPNHVEANERLAEMYGKQGLVTEARSLFMAMAEQCLKGGQKDKALVIYEKVLGLEPGNVKVRLLVAEIHSRDGEPARAVEGFLAVTAELRKRNMNEEALKVLQKASRLQPANPEILGQMAELLQSAGKNPQEALGLLESLHHGDPANLRNLQLLGEAYLGAGKNREFQKLLGSAAAGEARIVLMETEARFLVSRQEPEKAAAKLRAAAEDALKEGLPERSAALLEEALRIQPDDAEILEAILGIWTQSTQREGMMAALERLTALHARMERWTDARRSLERLDDLAPENALAHELRVKHPDKLGQPGAASPDPEGQPDSVPTLDELEKVVELEVALEDPAGGEEPGLDLLDSVGSEEGTDEIRIVSPEEDDSLSAEGEIGEQGQSYTGRSVIQEMRGEPGKPDLDEDFLSEHLTEAEVFLKYGLVEKAREQLQTILDRYPDHLPSLMKMKEVRVEEGRKPEAARLCLRVSQLLREKGEEEKASEWVEQARDLDPGASASAAERSDDVLSTASLSAASADAPDLSLDMDERSGSSSVSAASSPSPGENESWSDELSIDLSDGSEEGADSAGFEDRVSQLEFSLEQGLREEAEELLRSLEKESPSHPALVRLRAKLQTSPPVPPVSSLPVTGGDLDMDVERAFSAAPAKAESAPGSLALGGEDFFDLAAELRAHAVDSAPEPTREIAAGLTSREEENIDEIFKAFRRKVDQQVEEEDYETRYNLGIAYKEMGLLDEAIGEFQYASRDPKLFMECCSILGICFREKGMSDLAVKWYRKALESTGHPDEKYLGLRYDLGELHLERGEHTQALALFSEVYGTNSNYRDVASRIRELKKRVG